jgi:hypothetical protein
MPAPGDNPELDAQTRVPLLWAISIVFIVISSVAVLLRLYTRQFVVRNVGLDDVTIVAAVVCFSSRRQSKFDLNPLTRLI